MGGDRSHDKCQDPRASHDAEEHQHVAGDPHAVLQAVRYEGGTRHLGAAVRCECQAIQLIAHLHAEDAADVQRAAWRCKTGAGAVRMARSAH